jgi:hypothetical protein
MSSGRIDLYDVFGRQVVLSSERWENHILRLHPEMSELFVLIEQVLSAPDLVMIDRDDPNRESYYLLGVAGRDLNRHVKVCVEFPSGGSGHQPIGSVVTAYISRDIKKGETLKWQAPD